MEKIYIDRELIRSVLTLATAIEARDPYTGGHTWRVSQYAKLLAAEIGFGVEGTFIVGLGGLVHDLGKIGIQDSVLLKPERLTEDEFNQMKRHPIIGDELISTHPYYPILMDAVKNHHERYDGKGYPNAQRHHEMSPIAAVMAVADAFDAMTSTRAYRAGMPVAKALRILEEEKDKQFDGKLVDAFIKLAVAGKLDHVLGHCADERLLLHCPGCGPVIAPKGNDKDGSHIHCPVCKGKYVLHLDRSTFELEFSGTIENSYIAGPDNEQVTEFLKHVPESVDYSDYVDPNYVHKLKNKTL